MHILPMRPVNEWPQKISTRSWPQGGVEELHKVFKGMQNALNKVLKGSATKAQHVLQLLKGYKPYSGLRLHPELDGRGIDE